MASQQLEGSRVLELAQQIPQLSPQWVIIEGGEPLLREELFDVLSIIKQGGIATYLITNGMLLNEKTAKKLTELAVRVMISVDGTDKKSYEEIRKGADFGTLKKAVRLLSEYGILNACNITIGQHNYQQIEKFFQFAEELKIPKIIFLGLKPCEDYQKYVLGRQHYQEIIPLVMKCQREYGIEIFFDEPFFRPFLEADKIDYSASSESGIIVPSVSRCIFGDYLFVETNGDVRPCTFAPMVVGNAGEKDLPQIWEDVQKNELIQRIKDFRSRLGECRECPYLYNCGGCRSRTYSLTGNWFESDPSCPLGRR
jgi:radical SAM protein with 4Fe4S-binding SPASM domain